MDKTLKSYQDSEYEAWRLLVLELRDRGIEINDDDNLNFCLYSWANARANYSKYVQSQSEVNNQ